MISKEIAAYRNVTTGEIAPAHRLGVTDENRPLFQAVEGWEPVNTDGKPVDYECTPDGNWVELEN